MIFRFTLSSEYSGSLTLPKDPKGWKDMEVVLKRGLEYHGIFYQTMIQLEFSCGSGKEYIDAIYEQYGVDAVINILIEISCSGGTGQVSANDYSDDYSDDYGSLVGGTNAPNFEELYEGVLDLGKYNRTSRATFVDLLQSDFIQKIVNRLETKVNIDELKDLDNNDLDAIVGVPYNLTLPAKAIIFQAEYEQYSDVDILDAPFPIDTFILEIPTLIILDETGGANANSTPFLYSFLHSGGDRGVQNVQDFYENKTALPETIQLNLSLIGSVTVRNTYASTANFNIVLQVGGIQFSLADYPTNPEILFSDPVVVFPSETPVVIPFNTNDTRTIILPPGEKLWIGFLFGDIAGSSSLPGIFRYISSDYAEFILEINKTSVLFPTTTKAYPIHELGAMIAQRITGQNDPLRSELLGRTNSLPHSYDGNGCASFTALTNGKKIRKFPAAVSNMFISMADFYKFVNSIWNTGLGITKESDSVKLVIEKKSYFYNTSVILQCPNTPNIKTSVAKEYFVSDIIIGYENWENEEVNGIDEFNSRREYNTGIKAIDSKKEWLSPVIASPYAIEFSRRKLYSFDPTLDYKYDNDNFVLSLKRGLDGNGNPNELDEVEGNENYSDINNVISQATSYNFRISPARNLLRHVSEIAGSLIRYAGRAIKFTYGEGNYQMESQFTDDDCPGNFNNEMLGEGQDIIWDENNEPPIWIPEYLDFEYPIGFNTFLEIKANPYQCIEVSETDENFIKGFIIDAKYKPVSGMASFRLLRANEA